MSVKMSCNSDFPPEAGREILRKILTGTRCQLNGRIFNILITTILSSPSLPVQAPVLDRFC